MLKKSFQAQQKTMDMKHISFHPETLPKILLNVNYKNNAR